MHALLLHAYAAMRCHARAAGAMAGCSWLWALAGILINRTKSPPDETAACKGKVVAVELHGLGRTHASAAMGKKGAEKALALSGAHMGKRYVDVRAAEAPNAFAPNKAVAIMLLPALPPEA